MASDGYLRFPHLQGDLLTFIAEDDVWLAPVAGGRPWRLTTDRAVQLALEALDARPPLATPGTSTRPAKRRPPLPPR